MKMIKSIALAGTLAVACMELFSGCSKQEKPSQPIAPTVEYRLDAKQAELAYLKGWKAGFDICHDINNGTLPNKGPAFERQADEQKRFMADLCR